MPDKIQKPEQPPFLRKREEEKRRKATEKEVEVDPFTGKPVAQEKETLAKTGEKEVDVDPFTGKPVGKEQLSEKEKEIPAPAPKKPKEKGPSADDIMRDWPQVDMPTLQRENAQQQKKEQQTFERRKTPEILMAHPRNGKPLVKDYGDHIVVTRRALLGIGSRAQEKREKAVGTALAAAAERFGQPVHFEGNPAFLRETAAMAVKMGIALEPGNKLGEQIYKKALEKQRREQERALKMNAFSQALVKQRELEPKKEVAKGLAR